MRTSRRGPVAATHGAGTATDSGNFGGTAVDLLAATDCFCLFDGDSFSAGLLYLFPQQIGIGQFQPYVRHSEVYPDGSSDRDEFETGVNYVIDGHNARVSLIYQYGDLFSKGIFDFGPDVRGNSESAVKLGIQLQL